MYQGRNFTAQKLTLVGGAILALGIFLMLIKVMILLAWYAAGVIALAGLAAMVTGMAITGWRRKSRDEIEDRIRHF